MYGPFSDPQQPEAGHSPARILDVAKGVLVGLRHCGQREAFEELTEVSRRHRLPVLALSTALVSVSRGDRDGDPVAIGVIEREWGSLLAASRRPLGAGARHDGYDPARDPDADPEMLQPPGRRTPQPNQAEDADDPAETGEGR